MDEDTGASAETGHEDRIHRYRRRDSLACKHGLLACFYSCRCCCSVRGWLVRVRVRVMPDMALLAE